MKRRATTAVAFLRWTTGLLSLHAIHWLRLLLLGVGTLFRLSGAAPLAFGRMSEAIPLRAFPVPIQKLSESWLLP
jgi:hypothetical protein